MPKKRCSNGSRKNTKTGKCVKTRKSNSKSKSKSKSKSNSKSNSKCKYDKVVFKKSTNKNKKLMAIFTNNKSKKTIHFGANGMSDYTKHKDKNRKSNYLKRHKVRENWEKCDTAGALSRWILWNKTSLSSSKSDFKKKFKL